MKVLKFGGSSIATAERINLVYDIVKSQDGPFVLVLSALGGCTNTLEKLAKSTIGSIGEAEAYESTLKELEIRHMDVAKELIPLANQGHILLQIKEQINVLGDLCAGSALLQELSDRTLAKIMSFGERMSSIIILGAFNARGLELELLSPDKLIVTDKNYLNAKVKYDKTNTQIRKLVKSNQSYIVPGFIAASEEGDTTLLGRGGSDFTAAIIAGALEVEKLEIWSDVDGMLSAHPKLVSEARPIEHLSYEEAFELSHFGAKVLHPQSILPVYRKNVPIELKNTFKPDGKGTLIRTGNGKYPNSDKIIGVSSLENIALLTVSGIGMIGFSGYSSRVFSALAAKNVNVILISQSSSEYNISIAVNRKDSEMAREALEESFSYEIERELMNPVKVEENLCIVAMIGDNMKNTIGIGGKALSALGENGVNIKALAQGSSERNLSIIVEDFNEQKAVNVLHERFFGQSHRQVHIFMAGVGNVGKHFLKILNDQRERIENTTRLRINVVGLCNSKKHLFDPNGLDLTTGVDELISKGNPGDIKVFVDHIKKLNLRNAIFIDNTASNLVSNTYEQLLSSSISVVGSNKIAWSDAQDRYESLLKLAKNYNVSAHYETCVGAALPIINTLQDLVTSGDHIHQIDAVLSGSLNFIFNNYLGTDSFGSVVQQAKDEGYTEPDPLIDLSGVDVARKILILAREAGYKLEMEDVNIEPLLPTSCLSAPNTDQLFVELENQEGFFKNKYNEALAKGCKLKVVATFKDNHASVGIQEIPASHPFYHLDGKDNIVSLLTNRYKDQPLIVKGAGAGPEITASGVFSDIMRIINK